MTSLIPRAPPFYLLRLNALLPLPQDVKVDVMVSYLKHVAECTELTLKDTQEAGAIQSDHTCYAR